MKNNNNAIREEIINFLQDDQIHTTKEIFNHICEVFENIDEKRFTNILYRFHHKDERIKKVGKATYKLSSVCPVKIEIDYDKYTQALKDKLTNDIMRLNQNPFEQYQTVDEWKSAAKIVELNKQIISLINSFKL